MNLFDVYPLFNIQPVKASGCYIWDSQGDKYLDFYGGHAVISIGHSHPEYVNAISGQLNKMGFYSNSVKNPLQIELAQKLGKISGYGNFQLFLCNSGAEANENALKLASFKTGKKKFISFSKSFHGRTSLAVALSDNPKIIAPANKTSNAIILPLNDIQAVKSAFNNNNIAAVIIEGIQGIGGINIPDDNFLKELREITKKNNSLLIIDEIQSGYGRSGKFFAHQYTDVEPDIITIAKGMGNGFPVGGVLIHPDIKSWNGMLGTTFGGNYLACSASIAVLDILKRDKLIENSRNIGSYIKVQLGKINNDFRIRGKGLMIGLEFDFPVKNLRNSLLSEHKIFTGVSAPNIIRLLPPLCVNKKEADIFINAFKKALSGIEA